MKKFIASLIVCLMILLTGVLANATGTVLQLRGVYVEDTPGKMLLGLNMPGWTDAVVLSANVAATYTLPTGTNYVLFSSNADFYVNYSTTATVPGASTTTGVASELNPVLRGVSGLTSISLISASTCIITISCYK